MSDVTAVIPCWNAGDTLLEAVASVRAQTLPVAEIVVVDDGSTEAATREVLAALANEAGVRVLRQPNAGLPAARNAGFSAATTENVVPLDADDRLHPRFLARCRTALTAHPRAGFAYTDIRFFGERTGVHRQLPYNFHDELFRNQISVCALIRRRAWEAVHGYREDFRDGAEDWEFWISLGAAGFHGVRVPEPLFEYRVRHGSMSTHTERVLPEITARIREVHRDLYGAERLATIRREWKGRWNPRDPAGWIGRVRHRLERATTGGGGE